MTDDISGEWHGTYRYPGGAGPVTPFIAIIEERAGHLSGSIVEPHEYRPPEMAHATLVGRRSGTSIDFTKTYHRSGPQYANPVDYVGRLSSDGNRIVGMWSLLRWDGAFEMYRDAAGGSGTEVEEGVETMAPILSG